MATFPSVALLGPPNGGAYFREWDLVYRLMERGLMSIAWLVLRIGPDGRIAKYRVLRD